jgi:hypothetical protein
LRRDGNATLEEKELTLMATAVLTRAEEHRPEDESQFGLLVRDQEEDRGFEEPDDDHESEDDDESEDDEDDDEDDDDDEDEDDFDDDDFEEDDEDDDKEKEDTSSSRSSKLNTRTGGPKGPSRS